MFVLRQLTKDQMISTFLESWITKYEALYQAVQPIQSNNPFFIRKENGEVETRFLKASPKKKDVTVFSTQMVMIQPVSYVDEKGLVIKAFLEDGKPCYEEKSSSGQIWWDICDCDDYKEESIDDDDQPRRRKKKSPEQGLKERYEAGDPEVDLLGEPSGKFDYYVFNHRTRKQKPQLPLCKETKPRQDTNHESKPPLIPYYQNILSQIHKYHPTPSTQTQT